MTKLWKLLRKPDKLTQMDGSVIDTNVIVKMLKGDKTSLEMLSKIEKKC